MEEVKEKLKLMNDDAVVCHLLSNVVRAQMANCRA